MCEHGAGGNQTQSCALLSLFVKKSGLLWGMAGGGRERGRRKRWEGVGA